MCDFTWNLGLTTLLFAAFIHFYTESTCGIPVQLWIEVQMGIYLTNAVLRLLMVPIIRYRQQWSKNYAITITILSTLASMSWLFYGSQLFFGKKNNCMLSNDTKNLDLIMIGLMLLGFMKILLIISLFICYLLFNCLFSIQSEQTERMNYTQISRVLDSMKSMLYNPDVHNHETEC